MKIVMHTSALRFYSLREALTEIHNLGCRHVELAANISETLHFAAHTAGAEEIIELRNLLEAFNLQLAAIDFGGWDVLLCIANLNESQRITAVQNVKRTIDVTSELGCPLITSHLWGLPQKRDASAVTVHYEIFKSSVRELCLLLEARNVRLNFMPHPGGFIEESNSVVELIRETGCPQVEYTYGIGHTFVISTPGQGAVQIIEYAGQTLTYVLVSDSYRADRIIAPPEHLVPGSGDIHFTAIFHVLKSSGYDGFLSVYIISEADRIVDAAEKTKRELERLLDVSEP